MFRVVQADTLQALFCALDIRHQVFVVEQGVSASLEKDDYDVIRPDVRHVLLMRGERPIGAGRVLTPYNGQDDLAKVQRIAILPSERLNGAGRALMEGIHAQLPHVQTFVLGAQEQALGFYRALGYAAEGERYIEAGIPHRNMRFRRLDAPAP